MAVDAAERQAQSGRPTAATTLQSGVDLSRHALPGHSRNGFDVLRVFAATLVIFGHAFPLTKAVSPGLMGNGVQTIGVKIFFIISGFLITSSWRKDPHVVRYALRRFLRIIPGLFVVTALCALVLGLAFTELPWRQYLASGGVWRYFRNVLLYPVYDLPGVFAANPYPVAVNGSLWSLPVEVAMYIVTPILIGFDRSREKLFLPLFVAFTLVGGLYFVRIAPPAAPIVVYGTNIVSLLDVAVYFYLGAVFAVFDLHKQNRPLAALLLLSGAAYAARDGLYGEIALLLFLPATVIAIGSLRFPLWDRLTRGADVSYGLYLYGFPIQQAIAALFDPGRNPIGNFLISLPLTLAFAIISWFWVEKPILMHKPTRSSGGL
ncbi:acyltransferase [Rhodoblastus sp. 17X3]|uniref:acyltransferase family protein n=1 Tax=Rhodoblastus sp. 17X3 TaxID=3047026 RepID=UPI0024B790D9|nr:acyltransferase [Rhodoblastus sp. 17X3]MDI9850023.1 acyltransferase [Rhodoblastus sp. 17X3]